ncbi:glycosyltransferase [Paraburkholderia rhizosphaerae]|uniref:Glycosyl transferase family 1 n=1 Tax=Paraburkholderia rhizosphaerae TaxID=480658 RepID=A0A4R8L3K4_9BURK|nr:glycosyltransferase [Paraburkholderia rhizosphaerae]TDY37147.1 glycosyl transferase family 1 [Paraburkholderia rhizosphaerae]
MASDSGSICIIGRCTFGTGIGAATYAACELLSRYYSISVFPTERHLRTERSITLPNGTLVTVCTDLSRVKVVFYTDVLWNGAYDFNYSLVPEDALSIAHVAYDSDELPPQWVKILNERFDVVLFMSRHLESVARKSGVEISVGTLPLALDIEGLLSRTYRPPAAGKVKFCSIAAFHARKGVESLVEGFIKAFGSRTDVELTVHSNLAIGESLERVKALIGSRGVSNIVISCEPLSDAEKNALIERCDVFVNCSRGEGYSIGPREALALGKVLVVTNVGGHNDLHPADGVFVIPATIAMPARYPEIDNLIAGRQYAADIVDVEKALTDAFQYVSSGRSEPTMRTRRELAAEFCFTRLESNYGELINTNLRSFRPRERGSRFTRLPTGLPAIVEDVVGYRCASLSGVDRTVVQAHDGGFFSVFNVFMSHLVWDQRDKRRHLVLPDWNVDRMIEREGTSKFVSFCYGRPGEGNVWSRLFKPLYGLTELDMDDAELLYRKGTAPRVLFNQDREPQLTYVHAYKLYKSGQFAGIRRQYHKAFTDHVHLRDEYRNEVDEFCARHFAGKFVIAAHVKHPSHALEQPDAKIAHVQAYVEKVRQELSARGIDEASPEWAVFLATDQDRVVARFRNEFGGKLVCYTDVRRTTEAEDARYDKIEGDRRRDEGFQVQHLVAANPDSWDVRMAWEVIRDAMTMSRCNVLLHVVSNVSTAVSYMNPDIELIFCSAEESAVTHG